MSSVAESIAVLNTLLPMVWGTGSDPEEIVRPTHGGRWVFRVSSADPWRVDAIEVVGLDRDAVLCEASREARRIVREATANMERDHGHVIRQHARLVAASNALRPIAEEK